MKQKTFCVWDYHELNAVIQEAFARPAWNAGAYYDWGNGIQWVTVQAARPNEAAVWTAVEAFCQGTAPAGYPAMDTLLAALAAAGRIPEGDHLIVVG